MVLENQENMDLGGMQGLGLRPTRNKRKHERVAELLARLSERTGRASLHGFSIFCKCGTLFREKGGKGHCDSLTKFYRQTPFRLLVSIILRLEVGHIGW